MIVAIQGAVVVSQEGRHITYVQKCEKCGNVQPGTHGFSKQSETSIENSSFHCIKCGNTQKVSFQG